MIFSSLLFLFVFLPAAVLVWHICRISFQKKYSISFWALLGFSLIYYGWWNPRYLYIILISILVNYGLGHLLARADKARKMYVAAGVLFNISVLFYFKYMDFFLTNINQLANAQLPLHHIVLPIGISFFTFQQIAYLADIYNKKYMPQAGSLLHYALFVCFFPQLVAGPIVHHQEMMPQFLASAQQKLHWPDIGNGLILLSIGLAKKVIVADNLSPVSIYAFDTAETLSLLEALFSSACYTLQLYFDFSGYCDMASGCAMLFGTHLPWNFNSPYKASTIQDFWHRWHITLSRWMRDYLYIPLGGNRQGQARTSINIFLTFLLGGLWHGAAWTFVLWGGLHGIALLIHRYWSNKEYKLPPAVSCGLTFIFVSAAWIVFRASDFACVIKFYEALTCQSGIFFGASFSEGIKAHSLLKGNELLFMLPALLFIVFFTKNSMQLIQHSASRLLHFWAIFLFILSTLLMCIPDKPQEFIYFQF